MKIPRSIFLATILMPVMGQAQTSHRDVLIRHIEEVALGQTNVFSAKTPFIEILLASAKSANQSIDSEKWERVKVDMAAALTKTMLENGGPMGGVLFGSLDTMSDVELERVDRLLNDPAYRKFQVALGGAAIQERIIKKSAENSARVGAAVNAVLLSNGLKVSR